MPTSEKSNAPDPDSAGTDGQETIVLSTTDANTPAALVVDENGILDFDKDSATNKECSPASQEKHPNVGGVTAKSEVTPPKKPEPKPVDKILKLLRKPERSLINGYCSSSIHKKLKKRFDWYSRTEGSLSVGNELENRYGGTYTLPHAMTHFIRNNILVSLVLVVTFGQLVSSYLSTPARNRYADTRPVVKTDESELPAAPVVVELARARDRSQDINHCAVSNNLRQVYENAESRTVKKDVLTEITGFITAYSKSDLENQVATLAQKSEVTISRIRATLPRIRSYSAGISEEINQLTQKYSNIDSSEREIDLTTVSGVNKSIKMRARLLKLETRMRNGLAITKALPLLEEQLLRIERLATEGRDSSPPWMSRWAVATSQQDLASFTASIDEIIKSDIHSSIERATVDTFATKLYKLRILAATLRDFGDLVVYLGETSNHTMVNVGERQNSSNNRLRELLGYEDPQDVNFLDYDNCLTALNKANVKLSSR